MRARTSHDCHTGEDFLTSVAGGGGGCCETVTQPRQKAPEDESQDLQPNNMDAKSELVSSLG